MYSKVGLVFAANDRQRMASVGCDTPELAEMTEERCRALVALVQEPFHRALEPVHVLL